MGAPIIAPTARATAYGLAPVVPVAEASFAYFDAMDLQARVGGEERFKELTDDDKDGIPDPDVIAQIVSSVEREADAYFLSGQYDTPLTLAQLAPVRNALLDIANYRAKVRGDREASQGDRQLYEDAIGLLMAVAKRQILLDKPENATRLGEYLFDSSEQELSRDSLKVW